MKNFTFLPKVGVWAILIGLVTGMTFAQNFTATQSGGWNEPATWGGGSAPSYTIGALSTVTIPSGITVTLDNILIVDGLLAVLDVDGSLTSSGNGDLLITLGTVSGDGSLTMEDITFNGGTFSFTGDVSAKNVTSATAIQMEADLMVEDMFTLSSGTFTVATNGNFEIGQDGMIVINSGTMALSGGTLSLSNAYDVTYSQGSSTSGFEMNGSGLRNLTVDVGTSNSVTFTTDIDIDGALTLESGTMILNGNDLTVNGSISATGNGQISSTDQSDITLNTTAGSVGTLMFSSGGNDVDDFNVNIGSGNWITIGSDLNIHGTLNFTSGGLNADDNDITIESTGDITGTSGSSYIMTGADGSLGMHVAAGGSSYVIFPVGTSEHYMPANIQLNSGSSAGIIRVGVDEGVRSQGTSGTDWATDSTVVDATWFIEPAPGLSNVNANIRFFWWDDNEVNGFDRNSAVVGHYTSGSWQMLGNPAAATQVNSMWMLQANNIDDFSPFAIFEAGTSSIAENNADPVLGIYPNPSAERINISFTEDVNGVVNMDIVDAQGKVMNNYILTGNDNSIDISHLPSGNYFVRFFNDEFNSVRKIVKL